MFTIQHYLQTCRTTTFLLLQHLMYNDHQCFLQIFTDNKLLVANQMKYRSEITGFLENPSLNDIEKSFYDPEIGNVAGNIYELTNDSNHTLSSISGDYYENFSLCFSTNPKEYEVCKESLKIEDVKNIFKQFFNNDLNWYAKYEWKLKQHSKLNKLVNKIFKKT